MSAVTILAPLHPGGIRRAGEASLPLLLSPDSPPSPPLPLFSIVALKTLDISQGSVATHLRCGGIFSDSIIAHFLLILTVK